MGSKKKQPVAPASKDSPDAPATPADYYRVFEMSAAGQRVQSDLLVRFSRGPVFEGGIDGVRKSDFRAGARAAIEHIIRRINQANGVNDPDPPEQE